jgi:hypothetical protein
LRPERTQNKFKIPNKGENKFGKKGMTDGLSLAVHKTGLRTQSTGKKRIIKMMMHTFVNQLKKSWGEL